MDVDYHPIIDELPNGRRWRVGERARVVSPGLEGCDPLQAFAGRSGEVTSLSCDGRFVTLVFSDGAVCSFGFLSLRPA